MKVRESKPQLKADGELRSICQQLISENKTEIEWDEIESDDMFETQNFTGGYDATEQEFLFSYYDITGKEWWIYFPLSVAKKIADGHEYYLDLHEPS